MMKGRQLMMFWLLTAMAALSGAAFLWIVWFSDPFKSQLIGYVGAIGTVTYGLLVFWMVRDCIRRPFPQDTTKLNWLVIILLTAPVGTTLYYLVVIRKNASA